MRQIVLDTETTGLETSQDHRIIEIGCVEVIDRKVTNHHWHQYLNPDREVDAGAFSVHGISTEFLQDKPRFTDLIDDFLAYVDGAELVIHNAAFDVGFLNHEIAKLNGHYQFIDQLCPVLDSLKLARQKHPGQKNNLDALCKRYDIDNSSRELHGALLDAEILAEVYLAMTGGQTLLMLNESAQAVDERDDESEMQNNTLDTSNLMLWHVDEKSQQAHQDYKKLLQEKAGVDLWQGKDEMR